MERRVYFVIGDLLANAVAGVLAGATAASVVGIGWNMLVAMVVAMMLGAALALPVAIAFFPWFGALEIMLPVMTAGMASGGVVGMVATSSSLSAYAAGAWGGLIGVVVLVAVSLFDARLRSRGDLWTS